MSKWIVYFALLVFYGCSPSPETPEGLLRMYVNDVATKKVGKDYYLKYTAGALRESAEAAEEEALSQRNFLDKVSKVKVDVLNKNCQEKSCVLTYIVSYKTIEKDKEKFSTETKKLAEFVKEEGDWKISNVTNLKTHHESLEAINALEEN
ncbi:MAG: hypothetical protein WEB87_02855 [Bacteriovoracaceae bacterium]